MCAIIATNTLSSPEHTVVLYGSPHRDGATGTLVSLYLSTRGGKVTMIDCFERAVRPCDDCGGCRRERRCVKRDMDDIYEAIESATTLVVATPVYNRSFPAPLKAVIDRLQCYWSRRFVHGVKPPIETPKTAVLLTVCGSGRDDGAHVQAQLGPALTVLHVTETAAVHLKGTDGEVDWEAAAKAIDNIS